MFLLACTSTDSRRGCRQKVLRGSGAELLVLDDVVVVATSYKSSPEPTGASRSSRCGNQTPQQLPELRQTGPSHSYPSICLRNNPNPILSHGKVSLMTLAVIARFPWGPTGRMLDSAPPGITFPHGLVVASDSRFSLRVGGHTDTGRKVYVLAPNAALVFAGDVETAQRAISDLERLAQRMRGRGRMDPIQHVPDVLRRAHTKAKERAQRRR